MRGLAVLLSATVLLSCGDSYPPCSPGDEDETVVGPTLPPAPGPGGPGTPDHGAEDDSDHGYSRTANGTVCSCDAREADLGVCSKKPPTECDLQRGYNIETGECAPRIVDQPAQSAPVATAVDYWCCLEIRCKSKDPNARVDIPDHRISPAEWGEDKNRDGAWRVWDQRFIRGWLKELQAKYGDCWKQAGSCYEDHPKVCLNYPN